MAGICQPGKGRGKQRRPGQKNPLLVVLPEAASRGDVAGSGLGDLHRAVTLRPTESVN